MEISLLVIFAGVYSILFMLKIRSDMKTDEAIRKRQDEDQKIHYQCWKNWLDFQIKHIEDI